MFGKKIVSAKRKGFMHVIEGVIASMVLLLYFSTASLPPLQQNEWTYNSYKQSGIEYLEAIERANLSSIAATDSEDFSEITNRLFDSSDILITTHMLPSDYLRIGLVLNNSAKPNIRFNAAMQTNDTCISSYGWNTEFGCIINISATNYLGKNIVLADTDVKKGFDKVFIYDSIYVDVDGDGTFDTEDGPFFANDYITIGGASGGTYYVGYIDNSTKSVALWNATPIQKYSEMISQTNINGRNTTLLFYSTELSRDISQFDVIVINSQINIAPYASKLKDFLRKGNGIVEVANITASNYNADQTDIFGIANVTYGLAGSSNGVHTTIGAESGTKDTALGDYFSGVAMRVILSPAAAPYDVSGLPNSLTVRTGRLNVSGTSFSIAVASSSSVYDRLYVDFDKDYNFSESPDNIPYFAGSSFNLPLGTYAVKNIWRTGSYANIRPAQNATLVNFFNPVKLDSNNASWAAAEQENTYNVSSSSVGSSFTIYLQKTPILGDNTTLLPGNHTYGIITPSDGNIKGSPYNLSITNVSTDNFLNIDLDHDSHFDGFEEGPFANGELVEIGPEKYKIRIWNDSSVMFVFSSRKKVPASIASEKYSGRTVWMPETTSGGHDSWSYLLSSIIWASPKAGESVTVENYGNLFIIKKASFLSGDFYQPYILEMYRGYRKS